MTRKQTMHAPAQNRPWYRYKGPWLLMAGPAIVVVAGVTTAIIATRNADDLVADDYYKRGKVVNMDLKRQTNAEALGLTATLLLGDNQRSLRLQLTGNSQFAPPKQLLLNLIHPTRADQDQLLQLTLGGDNYYQGAAKAPLLGRWHVSIEDLSKQWRLTDTWRLDKDNALQLSARKNTANQQQPMPPPRVGGSISTR